MSHAFSSITEVIAAAKQCSYLLQCRRINYRNKDISDFTNSNHYYIITTCI